MDNVFTKLDVTERCALLSILGRMSNDDLCIIMEHIKKGYVFTYCKKLPEK